MKKRCYPQRVYSITVADMDRNGTSDLVMTTADSVALIARGDGRGAFAEPTRCEYGVDKPDGPAIVRVADMNRDGRPDLIVSSTPGVGVMLAL